LIQTSLPALVAFFSSQGLPLTRSFTAVFPSLSTFQLSSHRLTPLLLPPAFSDASGFSSPALRKFFETAQGMIDFPSIFRGPSPPPPLTDFEVDRQQSSMPIGPHLFPLGNPCLRFLMWTISDPQAPYGESRGSSPLMESFTR